MNFVYLCALLQLTQVLKLFDGYAFPHNLHYIISSLQCCTQGGLGSAPHELPFTHT